MLKSQEWPINSSDAKRAALFVASYFSRNGHLHILRRRRLPLCLELTTSAFKIYIYQGAISIAICVRA